MNKNTIKFSTRKFSQNEVSMMIERAYKEGYNKGFEDMKNNKINDSVLDITSLVLSVPVKLMFEKYGYTVENDKLVEYANNLMEYFNDFIANEQTVKEYAEQVANLTGICFEEIKD